MKKIIKWFINLDNLLYIGYIEALTLGKYEMLRKLCVWIGRPFPLFSMLVLIGGIGYLFIGYKAPIIEGAAYLFSSTINLAIKSLYKRVRPANNTFWSPIPFDQYSFPSGHAAGTMAVAFCLGSLVPVVGLLLVPWSIFVGISRFLGDFHHPSDVIGGFLVGIISGYALSNLLTRIVLF